MRLTETELQYPYYCRWGRKREGCVAAVVVCPEQVSALICHFSRLEEAGGGGGAIIFINFQ